jgi:hypothetical protein
MDEGVEEERLQKESDIEEIEEVVAEEEVPAVA